MMKHLFLLLFLPILFVSCSSDDNFVIDYLPTNNSLWQLEATLFDPGDGSGTFTPVQSDRILAFEVSRIISNGPFCSLTAPVGPEEVAVYGAAETEIIAAPCNSGRDSLRLILTYEEAADRLMLDLGCEEPCQLRYKRLQ